MARTTDANIRKLIRAYIGLLIKFPDNPYQARFSLRPELLPDDMQAAEGVVLESILRLKDQNPPIAPTRENVANWLAIHGQEDRLPVLEAIVGEVAEEEDARGLPTYFAFVDAWLQIQTGIDATRRAHAIMQEPYQDYENMYARAAEAFASAMPKSMISDEYAGGELATLGVHKSIALVGEAQRAGEIGWGLPFPAYRAFFSRFHPGEITTIIAATGLGKTNLAMICAEHHSWAQRIRSDSVLYELETTSEELSKRQLSRRLLVPYEAIDSGLVHLGESPWKEQIDEFIDKQKTPREDYGQLKVVYCPGWNVDQIILNIQAKAQAALAAGRNIAFWIDNLQRINWTVHNLLQREAYELIADRLSYAIRRYPNTHLFLIAQEYDNRVFGSTAIERMSQKMISLRREAPEGGMSDDFPVMSPKAGSQGKTEPVHLIDALGGKRYWHRKGDKHSGKCTLEILKTNSGHTGVIEILFDGALSIMVQDPAQIERLQREGRLPPSPKKAG